MTKVSMIGLDLAKNVFQVHGIDASGKVVVRRQLRRRQVESFFAGLEPGVVVGMEACGGAHHWGRVLQKLGHQVRMMPPAYVKPYVKRNKTDGRDAEGICEAMGRPTMRFVPVKSVESQAVLVLHRTRRLLVRQRTMTANAFRSALSEFGLVAAQGLKGLRSLLEAVDDPASAIPEAARMPLQVLARHWELGLTPRQFSTGGKQRSGAISKQGDRALRTLLTLGATAHLRYERARGAKDPWLQALLARRPFKVAAVAYAAKMARIIWAMLVTGEFYRASNRCPKVSAQAAA